MNIELYFLQHLDFVEAVKSYGAFDASREGNYGHVPVGFKTLKGIVNKLIVIINVRANTTHAALKA